MSFPHPYLDHGSTVPLYRQLYNQIKEWIETGRLKTGERLPSTREMAGLLGLNRATITAAYELLEAESLIQGQVGRGSFVLRAEPENQVVFDWDEFFEESERLPAPLGAATGAAISFASASPAATLFPVDEVRQCCREVLESPQAQAILQLGSPAGYGPLREYLLEAGRRDGTVQPQDDVLVTNGVQQGLDLVQRLLVRAGDTVLLEDPIYPGIKHLLARSGARLIGVPVGPAGMDVEQAAEVLRREKPRLMVVTPNFHNPTGATLPAEARRALLSAAEQAGTVVVENDSYGELRYGGEPAAPLKQMDAWGGVILLRSFSKIAFPGLRVGWLTARRALVARLAETKQLADLHTDQLAQALLLRFAESGRLEAHRARVLAAGAERLAAVLEACARSLPAGSRYSRPQGGMNLWVRLAAPLDAVELLGKAEQRGVTYLPGKIFEVSHHDPGGLRLSFASLPPDKIRQGVAILGQLFSEELERSRAQKRPEPAPAIV